MNKFLPPGTTNKELLTRVDIRVNVPPDVSHHFVKELNVLLDDYGVELLEIDDGYFLVKYWECIRKGFLEDYDLTGEN